LLLFLQKKKDLLTSFFLVARTPTPAIPTRGREKLAALGMGADLS
jgi:hypothetical protein